MKRVHDMIKTYSRMHRTDKYSQQELIEERTKKNDTRDNTIHSILALGIVSMVEDDWFLIVWNLGNEDFSNFTKRNYLKKISTLSNQLGLLLLFITIQGY